MSWRILDQRAFSGTVPVWDIRRRPVVIRMVVRMGVVRLLDMVEGEEVRLSSASTMPANTVNTVGASSSQQGLLFSLGGRRETYEHGPLT